MPPKKSSSSDLFSKKNSESKKEIERLKNELCGMLQRGLAGTSSSGGKVQKENAPLNGYTMLKQEICEDAKSRNILKTENRNTKNIAEKPSRSVSEKVDVKAKGTETDALLNSTPVLKLSKMSDKQKKVEVKKDCHKLNKFRSKQIVDKEKDTRVIMAERKQKLLDLQKKSLQIVTEHNRARSRSREKKPVQFEKSPDPPIAKPKLPISYLGHTRRPNRVKSKAVVNLDLEKVDNTREETTKIQKNHSNELENIKKLEEEDLNKAATKIQAYYRGSRQRDLFKIELRRKNLEKDKEQLFEILEESPEIEKDFQYKAQKLKVPDWLEVGPQTQPYNFISTLKRKLNMPVKGSSRYDNIKSVKEVKEMIEKTLKNDCDTPEKANRFKLVNEISNGRTPVGVTSRRTKMVDHRNDESVFKKPDLPKRVKVAKKEEPPADFSLKIDINKLKSLKLHTRNHQVSQDDSINDYESQVARRLSTICSNVSTYSSKTSSTQSSNSSRSTITEVDSQHGKKLSTSSNMSTLKEGGRESDRTHRTEELKSFRDYMVGFNSSVRTRRVHTPYSKISKALALEAPNVSLRTISDKDNSESENLDNLKRPVEKIVDKTANTKEMHVTFEAELHLLNDFNQSLKQFMEVNKNKSKTTPPKDKHSKSFENKLNDTSMMINQFMEVSDFPETTINETTINETNIEYMDMSAGYPENLQAGISIGMLDRLISDEDERIKNLKTILKIREKSLLDRTKGQLAWLEIQKKHLLETGKAEEASAVKKKQRGLVIKLQHENHEMQKLKQMQKAASKERKTILKEQRNMIKAQLSNFGSVTKLKRTPTADRKRSGPLKVLSYHRKEMMSSVTDDLLYTSCSESIISRYTVEGTDNGTVESDKSIVKNAAAHNMTENAKRCLSIREAALQKRRKAAEELLQWHEKLLEEEKKITELEMAASNIINQVPSVTIENSNNQSRYSFKGSQLNVLWENMTGFKDNKKFSDSETYNLSQVALERFCKDAKRISKSKEVKALEPEQNLEEGIKQSESTLNEIVANINNITDEISELYKLSSIPNQFQPSESASNVPETSIRSPVCTDTQEPNENTSEIGSESSLKTDETINQNITESIIAPSYHKTAQHSILTEEEMHDDLFMNTENTLSIYEHMSAEKMLPVEIETENAASQSDSQIIKSTKSIQNLFPPLKSDVILNINNIDICNKSMEQISKSISIDLKEPVHMTPWEKIQSSNITKNITQTDKAENDNIQLTDHSKDTENNIIKDAETITTEMENNISLKSTIDDEKIKSISPENSQLKQSLSFSIERDGAERDTLASTENASISKFNYSIDFISEKHISEHQEDSSISSENKDSRLLLSKEISQSSEISKVPASDIIDDHFENDSSMSKTSSIKEIRSFSEIISVEDANDQSEHIKESDILSEYKIPSSVVISSEKKDLMNILVVQEVKSTQNTDIMSDLEGSISSYRGFFKELGSNKESANSFTLTKEDAAHDLLKSNTETNTKSSKISTEIDRSNCHDLMSRFIDGLQIKDNSIKNISNIDVYSESINKSYSIESVEDITDLSNSKQEKDVDISILEISDNEIESSECKSQQKSISVDILATSADVTSLQDEMKNEVSILDELIHSEENQLASDHILNNESSELVCSSPRTNSINESYDISEVEEIIEIKREQEIQSSEIIANDSNILDEIDISEKQQDITKSEVIKSLSLNLSLISDKDLVSNKSSSRRQLKFNEHEKISCEESQVSTEESLNQNKSKSEMQVNEIDSSVSEENISLKSNNQGSLRSENINEQQSEVKKRVKEILCDANLKSPVVEKNKRVQDIYVTTVISPENSPELGSPIDGKEVKDVYGIEAEELHRKQLAIEQEIKHLKRQQKQAKEVYFYLREIPNKPPPPYKPPVLTPQTIIPNNYHELESLVETFSKILFESNRKKTLKTICCPVNLIGPNKESAVFVFDLCKEIALNHYQLFYEDAMVSWMKSEKTNFRRPLDRNGLKALFEKKLKEIFGFSEQNKVIKWSSKKGDNVDRLLIVESAAEETEWINYEKDELIVKDEVTKDIMSMLLEDAANEFKEIYAKKALKKL